MAQPTERQHIGDEVHAAMMFTGSAEAGGVGRGLGAGAGRGVGVAVAVGVGVGVRVGVTAGPSCTSKEPMSMRLFLTR